MSGAIPFHPLADLFPLIEGEDFEALTRDIAENGLHQPVLIWRGAILDGRNRYRALRSLAVFPGAMDAGALVEAGLARDVSDLPPGDLARHVISLNLRRRHLDETQRALIAAKLAGRAPGRPRDAVEAADNPANLQESPAGLPVADAARLLNVSDRAVFSAKALMREAPAAVIAAAERGEVSLHAARGGISAARDAVTRAGGPFTEEAIQAAYDRLREETGRARHAAKEAKKARRAAREIALAGSIAASNAALENPAKRYGVILADPEWDWEAWGEGGKDRSPENHYPLSTTAVIAARPVANFAADDAVLFLCATVPRLLDALEVMAAWGFAYKSHAIWDKCRRGTGYWFINRHELLLVGTRGEIPCPAMGTQIESVITVPRGPHSAKPEAFYEVIEAYFPHLPKIELNARKARPGWDCWGAEAPEDAP